MCDHTNVTAALHSLFDPVPLVGLDIHSEHARIAVCPLHVVLSGQGELDVGIVNTLVSPGGVLARTGRAASWLTKGM